MRTEIPRKVRRRPTAGSALEASSRDHHVTRSHTPASISFYSFSSGCVTAAVGSETGATLSSSRSTAGRPLEASDPAVTGRGVYRAGRRLIERRLARLISSAAAARRVERDAGDLISHIQSRTTAAPTVASLTATAAAGADDDADAGERENQSSHSDDGWYVKLAASRDSINL